MALTELLAWLPWVKPGRSGSERSALRFLPRSPLTGPRPRPPSATHDALRAPRLCRGPCVPPTAAGPSPPAPPGLTPHRHITMATRPAALWQRHPRLPRSELPWARLLLPGPVRPGPVRPGRARFVPRARSPYPAASALGTAP